MLFLRLIIKNLLNRKTRTLLTIIGISIGIATIIVFGLITAGLKKSMQVALRPGKADFTVAKADVADMILSILTREQVKTIEQTEGVAEAIPYVMALAPFGGNPYFIIGGVNADQLDILGVTVIDGRVYQNDNELIIGKIVAKNRNLKTGEQITINNKAYTISGIFESGVTMQDGGAGATIEESQKIQGIKEDQVGMVMVKVKEGYQPREVANRIEQNDSKLVSIIDLEDFNASDQGLKIIDSVSWAISLLAVVIGGIGVMNTIIMSVYERTREIGVLRSLGWRRSRVIRMILGEAIIIGLAATIVGVLLGLSIIWLVMNTEIGESWLDMTYEPRIFLQAFVVSILVVIIGALYPSYRASRLSPMEALRYE